MERNLLIRLPAGEDQATVGARAVLVHGGAYVVWGDAACAHSLASNAADFDRPTGSGRKPWALSKPYGYSTDTIILFDLARPTAPTAHESAGTASTALGAPRFRLARRGRCVWWESGFRLDRHLARSARCATCARGGFL